MTKGFLLIDQQMNTIIIPWDDPDIKEFLTYRSERQNNLEKIHKHNTLKQLDTDVRAYLKGNYDG